MQIPKQKRNRGYLRRKVKDNKQVRTGKARDESHGRSTGFNYDFNREKQKAKPVTVKVTAKFLKRVY